MLSTTEVDVEKIERAVATIFEQVIAESHPTKSLHRRLQCEIAKLAQQFGFTAITEYVLPAFRGDRDGRLDVVWMCSRLPTIAFEVDSGFRRKSIRKLLAIDANFRFWVYLGMTDRKAAVRQIDAEEKVRVIRLRKFSVKLCQVTSVTSPSLVADADKHSRSPLLSKPIGGYSVAEIRKSYPKAYQRWSVQDDRLLRDEFTKGVKVLDLAKHFQRKPGAIRSRLRKLGLK